MGSLFFTERNRCLTIPEPSGPKGREIALLETAISLAARYFSPRTEISLADSGQNKTPLKKAPQKIIERLGVNWVLLGEDALIDTFGMNAEIARVADVWPRIIIFNPQTIQDLTIYVSPLVPLIPNNPPELLRTRLLFDPLVKPFIYSAEIILSPVPHERFINALNASLNTDYQKNQEYSIITDCAIEWLKAWKRNLRVGFITIKQAETQRQWAVWQFQQMFLGILTNYLKKQGFDTNQISQILSYNDPQILKSLNFPGLTEEQNLRLKLNFLCLWSWPFSLHQLSQQPIQINVYPINQTVNMIDALRNDPKFKPATHTLSCSFPPPPIINDLLY